MEDKHWVGVHMIIIVVFMRVSLYSQFNSDIQILFINSVARIIQDYVYYWHNNNVNNKHGETYKVIIIIE